MRRHRRSAAASGCCAALFALLATAAACAQSSPAPVHYPPERYGQLAPMTPPTGEITYQNALPLGQYPLPAPAAPPGAWTYPASYMQPPEQTARIEPILPATPKKKRGRDGPHQGTWLTTTWLAGGDLGITDVETRTVWAFPFFTDASPLIITPGFGVHYWDGPAGTDVPPRLYDGYLQFRWLRQITPRVGTNVSVTPGIYSDFEKSRDESIRITGRAISMIEWSPAWKIALGVIYLDRNDVGLLPAAGVIWSPNDDTRLDLIFPRPRLSIRYPTASGDDACDETWLYLAGEFGGGSWAIQRAGGADDEITYRDYRLVLGMERKTAGHFSTRLEVAYVFGRELEFISPTPDFEPDDTIMLRVALGI